MELQPANPSQSDQRTSAPAASATRSGAATLSADFDTFLQMLTAQARYQDPLEPVSSSDYAAQLAQFSMVEQQVFSNEQLTRLTEVMSGSQMTTLANWVGMDARASAPVQFEGAPVELAVSPAGTADRAQLVVYNDFGNEVARRDIPLTAGDFLWDGRDQLGQALGPGRYSFTLESYSGDSLISTGQVETYSRIVEAQVIDGEAVLKLAGGAMVSANDVTALRRAENRD